MIEQRVRHTKLSISVGLLSVDGILNSIGVGLNWDGLFLLTRARNVRVVLELSGGSVLKTVGRHDESCW